MALAGTLPFAVMGMCLQSQATCILASSPLSPSRCCYILWQCRPHISSGCYTTIISPFRSCWSLIWRFFSSFFTYSDNIAKNIFVFIFFLQVYCEIIDWCHCLSLRCPARWFDFHVLCNDHDGFRGLLYSPTDTMKRNGFYQFWFFWIISFE